MARRKKRGRRPQKPDRHPVREVPLPPAPQTHAPTLYVGGTVLLLAGAALLLYPCFLLHEEVRALSESMPYLPLVAVAVAAAGIALLLVALQRQGPSEPPFALEAHGRTGLSKLKELDPRIFFYDTWRELDREAAEEREQWRTEGGRYDWRPLVVFCAGAALLSLMEYFGHAPTLREIVDHFDPPGRLGPPTDLFGVLRDSPFRRLIEFAWWSGWRVLGFCLPPALIVKLVLREPIAGYGLQTRGFREHAWIYALFYAIVLVAVVTVSFESSFSTYYPFYKGASRSWYDFWTWELLYAAQFFSLEFFFRGFWLKASKRAFGSHAIYAMVVPYCMIHFGKPFPETLAAILAGVALGTLAMRTRSIWSGFLIHVSVAVSMDVAALLQTTGLPTRWWPLL